MSIVLPNLIVGPIVSVVGILVFLFRRQLRSGAGPWPRVN